TPSASTIACTRRGCIHTPSLAIAAYPAAICKGVAATLWPIGTEPYDEPDHCAGGSSSPAASPGMPTPVGLPRPNACWYSYSVSLPNSSAIMIVATLDEYAIAAGKVIAVPSGNGRARS